MPNKILSEKFVQQYKNIDVPFKNHGLGEFVYSRTYSRIKDNGENEQWYETIARVINGTFALKKDWFLESNIYWDQQREIRYAEKMYDLMFNVKMLPGGRGLWAMGTKITEDKHLYAALNNCAFVTTDDIETSLSEPFTFLMDSCMLGVGVGFDTKGAGKINIQQPNKERTIIHKIDDSREGWVHALKILLESYFLKNKECIDFDFSGIRPAGTILSHFGGVSSGPEPLVNSLTKISEVLTKNIGFAITSRTIIDVMNLVGLCVISGNVRRCLPIGALVHTENGLIPIENINIGDLVVTSNGLYPVTQFYNQGIQRTIKIITENGEFECTPNHKMAVFNGKDEYIWKTADSLRYGDMLISPRTSMNVDTYRELKWCPVKILKLVDGRDVETFDIEVKEKHEFYCNGYLTHNSASIAFGEHNDTDFITLKNYDLHPERAEFGWLSNNSIFANIGMDYTKISDSIMHNGEPGVVWLENMRKYSRMNHTVDMKDAKAMGANPCSEQTLENRELCCLVELFINRHETMEEFIHTAKYAFMYAKTITLGMTQWEKTNTIIMRNRRIGTSITGITNFIADHNTETLRKWCTHCYDFLKLYDKRISAAFKIPESIKITSVKPSGTISLLVPNTCSGIHFPQSTCYIRRVRVSEHAKIWMEMKKRGYTVEPSVTEPHTLIINFPINLGKVRAIKDVTMWEQLELAALMQEVWADNQVSCTVTFDPKTEGSQITHALNYFQYKLKGISFLPLFCGNLPQMPYEEISKETYDKMINDIKNNDISIGHIKISEDDHETELYCTTDNCMLRRDPKHRDSSDELPAKKHCDSHFHKN